MRCECHARAGRTTAAFQDLNTLLRKRWQTGRFTALTSANTPDLLATILNERWKELVLRGLRWTDIRRLNKEGKGTVLTRLINRQTIYLPPNDKRYALPIPLK
ncbi:RagB/SusD family nutrient uptake outer membrane protein [Paraflavitalea speifideaquila]|uniref:RagB/SusD family nutrient uptake outer membrane protein n=1 Tax=Paraflavitalea speifideaquila TaxID=3076558 RepID=UPI003312FA32